MCLSQDRIYSIYEIFPMDRFYNTAFVFLHSMLAEMRAKVEAMEPHRKSEILRETQTGIAKMLEGHFKVFPDIQVPFTKLAADRLISVLNDENCKLTVEESYKGLDEVVVRLWDELESGGHFFYIPIERAKLFDEKEPFGPLVSKKFPILTEDIQEAHRCYASGRYTATVFHLMRIMEVAVQRLGKKLRVQNVKNLVWQVILDQINSAISLLPAKSAKTKKFAAVAGHLYNVKLAWRNEVMHPKATYTEEEAENLLSLVKIFMAEVSSESERP